MSSSLTAEVQSILSPVSAGKTLIITIGNPLRSDDGVGPYIAAQLRSVGNLVVIDAQSNPENHLEQIASLSPAKAVFIDAADFKGQAGEIRRIVLEDIPSFMQSTHGIPLSLIVQLLREDISGPMHLLGIQIADSALREGLSASVKEAADDLVAYISKAYLTDTTY